jgi:hypothetical protein
VAAAATVVRALFQGGRYLLIAGMLQCSIAEATTARYPPSFIPILKRSSRHLFSLSFFLAASFIGAALVFLPSAHRPAAQRGAQPNVARLNLTTTITIAGRAGAICRCVHYRSS